MNKTLYRKYKPLKFSNVIGQFYIKKILLNSLKNNMISHAYIFSGPRGVGKTSIARIFSKAINCLSRVDGDACLECANCELFNSSESMDVIELDAASNNGIAEIRSLIDSTKFIPNIFSKKIYIIDEAHMLTNSSWNALLKTLEDPPKNVIFIFATTEVNKIPLTIISRCQRFDFEKISNENLKEFITKITIKENISIDSEAIDEIISISDGSARDSLSILNQTIGYSIGKISSNDIREIFGLIDINSKIDLINLILDRDIVSISKIISKYELKGVNFYKLTFQLIEILLDKLFFIKSNLLENLKILDNKSINKFNITEDDILNLIEILQNGVIQIKNNIDDRFFFELIMLNCISYLNKNKTKDFQEVKMDKNIFKKELDDSIDNKIEEIAPKVISNKDASDLKYSDVKFDDVVTPRKFEKENLLNDHDNNNQLNFQNKEIYKLSELIIEKPKKELDDKTQSTNNDLSNKIEEKNILKNDSFNNDNDILLEELDKNVTKYFSEIAFNNNKDIKEKINLIFEKIKGSIPQYPEEGYIIDALKILIASENGFVLLFDDELSALNLNLIADNGEFLEYTKKVFGKVFKVIGVSRDQARKFSEFVKKLKVNYKTYPDVNIEKLKLKIKNNATTKEIALEIFGEEINK